MEIIIIERILNVFMIRFFLKREVPTSKVA